MKTNFLSHIWKQFTQDVSAAVVDLYINRDALCLCDWDLTQLAVVYGFTLRRDNSRNVYHCAAIIRDFMEDDDLADFIDQLLSESPRITNWMLVKLLSPIYVDVVRTCAALRGCNHTPTIVWKKVS